MKEVDEALKAYNFKIELQTNDKTSMSQAGAEKN